MTRKMMMGGNPTNSPIAIIIHLQKVKMMSTIQMRILQILLMIAKITYISLAINPQLTTKGILRTMMMMRYGKMNGRMIATMIMTKRMMMMTKRMMTMMTKRMMRMMMMMMMMTKRKRMTMNMTKRMRKRMTKRIRS